MTLYEYKSTKNRNNRDLNLDSTPVHALSHREMAGRRVVTYPTTRRDALYENAMHSVQIGRSDFYIVDIL